VTPEDGKPVPRTSAKAKKRAEEKYERQAVLLRANLRRRNQQRRGQDDNDQGDGEAGSE
jgi:hypothetical protein